MGIFNRLKKIIQTNKTTEQSSDESSNSFFNIRVGDIVEIEETDYEVKGIIKFNDHGWRWIEYKLKNSRKTYWLSVEQDDDIEICFFEEVVAITTKAPKVYEYKGITYYMQEGSDAVVEDVQGNMNIVQGEEVDYYEYSDEDGVNLLSIEIWNGEVEMGIGREIQDYNVEIYPRN